LPHCANSSDFEGKKTVTEKITSIGREFGFYEAENDDFWNCLIHTQRN
jgi:hypothetical protein